MPIAQDHRIQRTLLMKPNQSAACGLADQSVGLIAKPQAAKWPLMKNNITRTDLEGVIDLLNQDDPILTQSTNVRAFEKEWSDWLGVKHSVYVNSGSSANLVTMAALKELHGGG